MGLCISFWGFGQAFSFFAHGFSFEGNFVGVVDEAVEDGVGQGGVANDLVPVVDGNLAGDEGGASVVAVFNDLEEVASLFVRQARHPPVIQDQEVGLGIGVHELGVASVAFGDGEILEEPGNAQIQGGMSFAAGFVSQGAGQVALTGTGGPGDEAVVALADPLASGQGEHELFVESAPPGVVDVLERGVLTQLGPFQAAL